MIRGYARSFPRSRFSPGRGLRLRFPNWFRFQLPRV